jgi:hypothetical protein
VLRIFTAVLTLLVIVAFVSGCYTIVGYPPEMEGSIAEGEPAESRYYDYYDYYNDSPYSYYRDYSYPYYYGFWSPYYRDYSWWYYDDYYYRYRDYDHRYVPEEKPEIRRRGTTEPKRFTSPERKRGSTLKEDKEESRKGRELPDQKVKSDVQRSVERKQRDSTSSSGRRSTRRSTRDEDEN